MAGGQRPVLLLEDLSRGSWPPPWSPERVVRVRATLEQVAATPPARRSAAAVGPTGEPSGWRRVAADPAPFLAPGLTSPGWLDAALPGLLAAEAAANLDGAALLHMDVRSDNAHASGTCS